MAVDRSQFTDVVEKGLKANKEHTKFYINFKKDGKVKQKVLDYTDKNWDKRTRTSKAKDELSAEKKKKVNNTVDFTETSTLNKVADIYFETLVDSTWTTKRKASYELYLRNDLGKKKIQDIRKVHIDLLRKSMETKGQSQRTKNGCSPRTIIQVLSKILKPILQYAVDNDVLPKIPKVEVPKIPKGDKKKVTNATNKFITLYKTIVSLYKDDDFYRALFLLAWYGRRWNEIRTLSWSDIDFLDNSYTIKKENNKAGLEQTYDLPPVIAEALSHIKEKKGLVFKSPVTGKELYPPKKQLKHVRDKSNIQELTMHYFRHIMVSAMGESGVADAILNTSLGHSISSNMVKTTYQSINHLKGSQTANKAINEIIK